MYRIDIDGQRQLVDIHLAELLSVDEVRRYVADLGHAFVSHRLRAGYLMRLDVSAATIQEQAVVASLKEQIAHFPKARRIAVVVGSSPVRMQVRRVMTQDYTRVFDGADEAMAWLTGPD